MLTVGRFAFEPWHSAVEFKRYLHRFVQEFPRINSLAGVDRTPYNQYDSIILPIETYLKAQGVEFRYGKIMPYLVSSYILLTRSRHQGRVLVFRPGRRHHRPRDTLRLFQNGCYWLDSCRRKRYRSCHPRFHDSCIIHWLQYSTTKTSSIPTKGPSST